MGVCYFRSFNILMDDLLFPLILFQKEKKRREKRIESPESFKKEQKRIG